MPLNKPTMAQRLYCAERTIQSLKARLEALEARQAATSEDFSRHIYNLRAGYPGYD